MSEPIRVLDDQPQPISLRALGRAADAQAGIIRCTDLLRDAATKLTLMREVVLTQMVTLDAQRQQRAATLANALLLEAAEAVSHAEDAVQDVARAKRALGRL